MDADALNLVAEAAPGKIDLKNCILTPHPGEAGRLLGVDTDRRSDSIASLRSARWSSVMAPPSC